MAKGVYSLKSIKMGAAGANGTMGTTLADISKIAAGTVTFDFPEPNLTDIIPEESDSAFVTLSERQGKTITFESMDLSLEALQIAFGGTIATNKLTPGVGFEIEEQSLEIITRKLQGTSHKWEFPRCSVYASISGSLSKSDLLRLKFTVKVLAPVDTDGDELPDFAVTQAA